MQKSQLLLDRSFSTCSNRKLSEGAIITVESAIHKSYWSKSTEITTELKDVSGKKRNKVECGIKTWQCYLNMLHSLQTTVLSQSKLAFKIAKLSIKTEYNNFVHLTKNTVDASFVITNQYFLYGCSTKFQPYNIQASIYDHFHTFVLLLMTTTLFISQYPASCLKNLFLNFVYKKRMLADKWINCTILYFKSLKLLQTVIEPFDINYTWPEF